jgi:hypothetical protein
MKHKEMDRIKLATALLFFVVLRVTNSLALRFKRVIFRLKSPRINSHTFSKKNRLSTA